MKSLLTIITILYTSNALAAGIVHCSVDKYVQANSTLQTVACGDLDLPFPDPVKGAIETSKGVGSCTELAFGVLRASKSPNIVVTMGYYDPKYGTPGPSGNFALTQKAAVIFISNIPQKFLLDFAGQVDGDTYRATCELK